VSESPDVRLSATTPHHHFLYLFNLCQSGLRTFIFLICGKEACASLYFLSLATRPVHLCIFYLWQSGLRTFICFIFGKAACAPVYF